MRRGFEVAIGGNHNVAPGRYLVAKYQHQSGLDFVSGAPCPAQSVHGPGFAFSTAVNVQALLSREPRIGQARLLRCGHVAHRGHRV
jgi:hypothetical protein